MTFVGICMHWIGWANRAGSYAGMMKRKREPDFLRSLEKSMIPGRFSFGSGGAGKGCWYYSYSPMLWNLSYRQVGRSRVLQRG